MAPRKKEAEVTPDNWEIEVAIALKVSLYEIRKVISRCDPKDAHLITAMGTTIKTMGELLITQKALEEPLPAPPPVTVVVRGTDD